MALGFDFERRFDLDVVSGDGEGRLALAVGSW